MRAYLIDHVDDFLGVTPLVANDCAGHSRKSRLEPVPIEGHLHELFTGFDVDGVSQVVVVVRVNQDLEVGQRGGASVFEVD